MQLSVVLLCVYCLVQVQSWYAIGLCFKWSSLQGFTVKMSRQPRTNLRPKLCGSLMVCGYPYHDRRRLLLYREIVQYANGNNYLL